ncbi:hypothetical protein [Ochrobactrum sp. BTU1]|jgi:hypothetical protein|uniref:hypothetical protein n=1 Tax=Ochrobactrum sp. BTU1 TaxID=2840456 RepID=UPI001C04930C|nr:hypothetical protein KMS41_18350 [Ochrobactrum sp. BTU1]
MNAASKLLWSFGLMLYGSVVSGAAHAQFFSSSGRSGLESEFFLQKIESTGLEDNHIAKVISYNNRAQQEIREYVVNCNPYMPQVLDSDDESHPIDIKNDPSSAEQTIWELWHAVCNKEFARISKRPPLQENLAMVDIMTEPEFNGTPYSLHYQALDYSKNLSNMVKVDAYVGKKKLFDTAYSHCDEDSGTVYWKGQKLLIGANDAVEHDLNSNIKDEKLIALSKTIWNGACNAASTNATRRDHTPNEASLKQVINPEITANKTEITPKSKLVKTPKDAEKAITEAYEAYMLSKFLCEYHNAGERKIASLKSKLKQLDDVAKIQKINVEMLWQKATNSFQKSANYQLMQAYKALPIPKAV